MPAFNPRKIPSASFSIRFKDMHRSKPLPFRIAFNIFTHSHFSHWSPGFWVSLLLQWPYFTPIAFPRWNTPHFSLSINLLVFPATCFTAFPAAVYICCYCHLELICLSPGNSTIFPLRDTPFPTLTPSPVPPGKACDSCLDNLSIPTPCHSN